MRKELTKDQWAEFFISDNWRALRAELEDRLNRHRKDLENSRGEDIEQIAINNIQLSSKIAEDKWLLYSLPEDLQQLKGEKDAEGRDTDRGEVGRLKGIGTRVGRDH